MNQYAYLIMYFSSIPISSIPAIAGLFFFRKIDKRYHPLIFISILTVTDKISHILFRITNYSNNYINCTLIYLLINTIFHLWFFYNVRVVIYKRTAVSYFVVYVLICVSYVAYLQNEDGILQYLMLDTGNFICLLSYSIILQLSIKGIALQIIKEYARITDGLFIYYVANTIHSTLYVYNCSLPLITGESLLPINAPRIGETDYYVTVAYYLLTFWSILCLRKKTS